MNGEKNPNELTDAELARFLVKLADAEVILSMKELRAVQKMEELARRIASGSGEAFTDLNRADIRYLYGKHGKAL